ncbi:glutathione S-transferase N-terminal domain-containing protein [Rhizobium bangladeshense]|uniref:Glutathione S-transferase N-terminal domain-containing protein n=1 Tax=Rhizobium bangladeshense TaxID=1138189 RepID=A0ABS7LM31_9HYPH|nr:glutathione S-transferase N-terminal domain-containing protein [Rhizobium bangladeshense]MBY3592360.1 glutathione S-transferase N-terminal domain-containing protein [Rhizobium bangladeshense]
MIDLYGSGSPNVARVFIALEELGLEYQAFPVDIFAGQQFEDWFGTLNPNRKVPVIVDRGHPAGDYTLFESAAILMYLAEKSGRLVPSGNRERYNTIQWLMVQVTTVGPMMGQLVHFSRYAPEGLPSYPVDRYRTQAQRVLEVMDQRLEERRYLVGDDLTIADIALFPWCRNLSLHLGEKEAEALMNVTRWCDELSSRPSIIRALLAQDVLRQKSTKPENAEPRILDRLFGRSGVA